MTSKPLSCNEKTKKTPTSCVFPVKHLLWVEFNINIKPQNISSRALQHFWSHDLAIHGKDTFSIICCYFLWLGHAVLHGLCKLSEPLIPNWCSNSHRISRWKLFQLPSCQSPQNPPIFCLDVVGRTMVTREASIRIWKGNPRPTTILPDCRTGSQSKSL